MKKWMIPGIGAAAVVLVIAVVVLTSGGKADTGTPAGVTAAYLDAMKSGDYAKAYQYAKKMCWQKLMHRWSMKSGEKKSRITRLLWR